MLKKTQVLILLAAFFAFAAPVHASAPEEGLKPPYPAPEFSGGQTWLNSKPLTMASLKGKVVLIDFWTYSCINCIRSLPTITGWDRDYRDKGLVIIGVHAPEFHFEQKVDNIKRALVKYNISYPVVVDNHMDVWNAYHNQYWPAHYLIDKEGKVVYTHFGEGNYAETENKIRTLLGMDAKTDMAPEAAVTSPDQTPETYLGFKRAERFSSPEALTEDVGKFTLPESLPGDHWALSGAWKIEGEHITAKAAGAKLQLHFTAGKVFLVLGTHDGKPVKASLTLGGKPIGKAAGRDAPGGLLTVSQHMLYELVKQDDVASGVLDITVQSPGLEAYAFTFGQ